MMEVDLQPDPAPAMLKDIRIVDLTSVVFGPYCTQMLADLGADVVKVESPAGDMYRFAGKAPVTLGMSGGFMALNRGKRSIALDLKQADDLAVIKGLIAGADVFIHNVRAQAIAKLGLGPDVVRALRPDIVQVHCTGFGQHGPYADLQAYDDVIQAATGTTTLLSRVDGDPRARYLPSLIADKVAGLHAAYAVLAAIVHRLRTGEGQDVEVPMLETFTSFMLSEHLAGQTFDPPTGPICYARQVDPDRQPFPTSDGYVSIVPYTDEAIPQLLALLGDAEFCNDERFASRTQRARNIGLVYRRIGELTPGFTTAELVARLQAAQIPAQPVRDIADIRDDPHLAATGFFRRREHPSEGAYYEMQPPVRFGVGNASSDRMPPRLGEHDAELRAEAREAGDGIAAASRL